MEANANLPFEITAVAPEINRKLLADFTGERTGFVQVNLDRYPPPPDGRT
jgi:hypothetical protein